MRSQITTSLSALLSLGAVACLSAAVASAQAPIIDASQPVNSSRAKSASANTSTNNSSGASDLVMQLQSLQQEVMELRGVVEEQSHQIETLKQQSNDRYNDLDKRISQPQSSAAVAAPVVASDAVAIDANTAPVAPDAHAASATVAAPAAVAATTMETAKPEEYEAYQTAYAKMKGQDFNGAIKAFTGFLATYPNSSLAPNSYYWLGMAYLRTKPIDLDKAQAAFTKVGSYTQSSKVPDAMLELGKVYFLKGDKPKAKATLQQVIDNYGASGSSAPQAAKTFLDQNFPAAKH